MFNRVQSTYVLGSREKNLSKYGGKKLGGATQHLVGTFFATAFLQFLLRLKKVGKGGRKEGKALPAEVTSEEEGDQAPALQCSPHLPLPYPD